MFFFLSDLLCPRWVKRTVYGVFVGAMLAWGAPVYGEGDSRVELLREAQNSLVFLNKQLDHQRVSLSRLSAQIFCEIHMLKTLCLEINQAKFPWQQISLDSLLVQRAILEVFIARDIKVFRKKWIKLVKQREQQQRLRGVIEKINYSTL
jgi:hypothetical protein